MPRGEPTAEGVDKLMAYYYPIKDFIALGNTRQQAWGLVQDLFEQGGPDYHGASIFDMNVVASRAVDQLNAAAAWNTADGLQAIDASMIAPAPWLGRNAVGQGFEGYRLRASLDLEGVVLDKPIYMDINFPGDISGYTKSMLEDFMVAEMQKKLDDYDEDQLAALGLTEALTITGLMDVQIMQL